MGALAFGAATNLLYARLLEPRQIGHLAVIVAVAVGAVAVADGGLQLFLTRAVARGDTDAGSAAGTLLMTVPVNVVCLCLFFGSGEILLAHGAQQVQTLALVVEVAVSVAIYQVALTLCQALGWFGARAWLLLGNGAVTAVATFAALTARSTTAYAIHATAAGYLVVGLIGIGRVCWRFGFAFVGIGALRSWYKSARGLWLNGVLSFATSSADILLAASVLPIAVVGYYQVMKKFAQVLLSPLAALLPLVYSHLSAVDAAARSRFVRRLGLASGAGVAIGLLLASLDLRGGVGALVGRRYEPHVAILVALVGVGAVQFMHNLLGYVCSAAGWFFRSLWINVFVSTVGAGVGVALAHAFGVGGLLVGLAIANAGGLVFGLLVTRSLLDSRARHAVAAGAVLIALAALSSYAFLSTGVLMRSVAMVVSLAAVGGCCWALGTTREGHDEDVEIGVVGGAS